MEAWQYRQQVDDGPETIGITHKRVGTLSQLVICCHPSQDVINDEDAGGEYLDIPEYRILIPEHQRHHTEDDVAKHKHIIDVAPDIGAIILLNNRIDIFAGHYLTLSSTFFL